MISVIIENGRIIAAWDELRKDLGEGEELLRYVPMMFVKDGGYCIGEFDDSPIRIVAKYLIWSGLNAERAQLLAEEWAWSRITGQ